MYLYLYLYLGGTRSKSDPDLHAVLQLQECLFRRTLRLCCKRRDVRRGLQLLRDSVPQSSERPSRLCACVWAVPSLCSHARV